MQDTDMTSNEASEQQNLIRLTSVAGVTFSDNMIQKERAKLEASLTLKENQFVKSHGTSSILDDLYSVNKLRKFEFLTPFV